MSEGAMKLARAAAAAAILINLSIACAEAKPIATPGETNLRKAPGIDSPILAVIPKGTTIEVGNCGNGWCEPSWHGEDGYILARNVGVAAAHRGRRAHAPHVRVDLDEHEWNPPMVYGPGYPPPVYYGRGPYYTPDYVPYYDRGWWPW